jgi:hypothetical protein
MDWSEASSSRAQRRAGFGLSNAVEGGMECEDPPCYGMVCVLEPEHSRCGLERRVATPGQ